MDRPPTIMNRARHPQSSDIIEALKDKKVEALKDTIQHLRARIQELETEREHLLEKNRTLRQQMTHTQLLRGLEGSSEDEETTPEDVESSPSPEQLYQLLPPSITFSEFFRIAVNEGLETEAARRYLRSFFADGLIEQRGSRLSKTRTTVSERVDDA